MNQQETRNEVARAVCNRRVLIIYGPTGVGKSALADTLARLVPSEIINADVGQCYSCVSIGTAKPPWREDTVRHHLFDIIDEPRDLTVIAYRRLLLATIKKVTDRGKLALIVGGSGFYIRSLFFVAKAPGILPLAPLSPRVLPDLEPNIVSKAARESIRKNVAEKNLATWRMLDEIDPERAAVLHPNDTYRVERALSLWRQTGTRPSLFKDVYEPMFDTSISLLWVDRDTRDLRDRIDARVTQMLESGWIEECRKLSGGTWETYLRSKGLIGYRQVFDVIAGALDLASARDAIRQETYAYSKRQRTFWRKLSRELAALARHDVNIGTSEVNLTVSDAGERVVNLFKELGAGSVPLTPPVAAPERARQV